MTIASLIGRGAAQETTATSNQEEGEEGGGGHEEKLTNDLSDIAHLLPDEFLEFARPDPA